MKRELTFWATEECWGALIAVVIGTRDCTNQHFRVRSTLHERFISVASFVLVAVSILTTCIAYRVSSLVRRSKKVNILFIAVTVLESIYLCICKESCYIDQTSFAEIAISRSTVTDVEVFPFHCSTRHFEESLNKAIETE